MRDYSDLIMRLEGEPGDCPFCGRDPYHYVDNGVGMERVAVTCCDEGIAYFQHGDPVLTEQMSLRLEAAACIREMVEWRPMSEAPKDRTPILARIYDDLFPRVVGEARDDLERWNGQRVVVHHPGLCEDGYDLGWSVSAPVGFGIGRDDWFSGWLPLPPAPGAEDE